MKRNILFLLVAAFVFGYSAKSEAQTMIPDKGAIIDSLTTIDAEIKGYFPRWKVCERDLQFQIYRSFINAQYPKENLDMNNVEILAAPRAYDDEPFEIITITCGKESMSAYDIDVQLTEILVGFLSGELVYNGADRGYRSDLATRDYCFNEIPQEIPLSGSQTSAIIDYLQPTDVTHAFTLSMFEQAIKIGKTGFWLRSSIGVDDIGYHFWQAGQGKITLQRPLYINEDTRTSDKVPYLINAYLGGSYKMSSGINRESIPKDESLKEAYTTDETNSLLDWMQKRTLNAEPKGKIALGLDFHMPFHPEAGITANFELPVTKITTEKIDVTSVGMMAPNSAGQHVNDDGLTPVQAVVPVLGSTGRISAFYHWWLDPKDPENYFRFDLGISYNEVQEYAYYQDGSPANPNHNITVNASELKFYKPETVMDWMFFKVEYRNQAAFPFGASVQLSNQILLGRAYIPLFGNWFYLEGKYSTVLRDKKRPYEVGNFFMISPVLRLTI